VIIQRPCCLLRAYRGISSSLFSGALVCPAKRKLYTRTLANFDRCVHSGDHMQMPLELKHVSLDDGDGAVSPSTLTKRSLRDLDGFFADTQATESILKTGQDPIIYEVYECLQPSEGGHLRYGTTILYPGRIGNEFYMTKGHFHLKEESSEVYLGLRGQGLILLQTRAGNSEHVRISKGDLIYVPPGWGHRTVNVGKEKLVFFFAYQADAGHDYESIQKLGFRKLVVQADGTFEVIDNPRFVTSI
jgi:glucose-6-phosphate isomerase